MKRALGYVCLVFAGGHPLTAVADEIDITKMTPSSTFSAENGGAAGASKKPAPPPAANAPQQGQSKPEPTAWDYYFGGDTTTEAPPKKAQPARPARKAARPSVAKTAPVTKGTPVEPVAVERPAVLPEANSTTVDLPSGAKPDPLPIAQPEPAESGQATAAPNSVEAQPPPAATAEIPAEIDGDLAARLAYAARFVVVFGGKPGQFADAVRGEGAE